MGSLPRNEELTYCAQMWDFHGVIMRWIPSITGPLLPFDQGSNEAFTGVFKVLMSNYDWHNGWPPSHCYIWLKIQQFLVTLWLCSAVSSHHPFVSHMSDMWIKPSPLCSAFLKRTKRKTDNEVAASPLPESIYLASCHYVIKAALRARGI